MNISQQKQVLIEVVIEGNPGVAFGTSTGEVANLCLSAFGDLELEGALFP